MKLIFVLALTFFSFVVCAEGASADQHRAELYLGFGSSKDTGYIYSDGAINHYAEFGVRFWQPAYSETRKYRGFMEFSLIDINKQTVNEAHFPFITGTSASTGMFSLTPNITFMSTPHWNGFIGVGPALITIQDNDHNNSQTYGSFVWQGGVIYEFNQNWNVGLKTQWTKITEKVNGQKYFQEFWNTNWFFSYAPDWANGR